MTYPTNTNYDFAVIGAGFSGSLTALGLHQIGYDVLLIEKYSHPRFAIGESSTPIADIILRDLSDRYDLPWLYDISRYGSWQQAHPEVSCGLKRGFSYYKHDPGRPFQTDDSHSRELLVAASVNNEQSDTNWFRADVDKFFVDKVKEAGITYYDHTEVTELNKNDGRWKIEAVRKKKQIKFQTDWLIDATGSNAILEQLGVDISPDGFRTVSSAVFSHFRNVQPWQDWLLEHDISNKDYPYNPDHSALHHLVDEGWMWMLRFNNGITSAGLIFKEQIQNYKTENPETLWDKTLSKYPGLEELFREAEFADSPGRLIQTRRLQRRAQKAFGDRWVALPHTAGFIDPLHSTGIAHSLSGVERILHAFEAGKHNSDNTDKLLRRYEEAVFNELDFIDLLVSGCYDAMPHFELYNIYSMLYFTAAINYEQKRLQGKFDIGRHQFLSADHDQIPEFTNSFYQDLQNITRKNNVITADIISFREAIEEAIEPYNIAGLLRPPMPNIYEHTAAEF